MWIKVDDQAPDHPKQLRAGPTACWLWVCSLAYCSRYLTDGHLPAEAVPGLQPRPGDVDRLLAVGLWERTPDGAYLVHDYLDYQPSGEAVRAKRRTLAERQRRWQTHREMPSNDNHNAVSNAATNASDNADPVPVPVPVPVPDPVPREGSRARATLATLHRSCAFCGRVCVPASLHTKLRRKLGGSEDDADARLRAWYRQTDDVWQDKPIGDNDFQFWELRFAEWQGTTKQATARGGIAGPPMTDAQWDALLEKHR